MITSSNSPFRERDAQPSARCSTSHHVRYRAAPRALYYVFPLTLAFWIFLPNLVGLLVASLGAGDPKGFVSKRRCGVEKRNACLLARRSHYGIARTRSVSVL